MDSDIVALSPEDLALLTDVLDNLPSMHNTAYAVKIIEQQLSYPIPSLHSLLRVFNGRPHIDIRDCRITPEEVERFLPQTCFPIDNRRHLIAHLIMAFERERMSVISRLATAQGHQVAWETRDA
jgi:hypothetical protein